MKEILLFCCILLASTLNACTAFQLQSEDGAKIYCRSMEFSFPLQSDLLIVPQNTTFVGTAPQGVPGKRWQSKYGYVGMNQRLLPILVSDGLNEKGLVVGCLYLQGFAHYEPFVATRQDETLGAWELASYLLGSCATTLEVKDALQKILVAEQPLPGTKNFVLPLHFYVCDKGDQAIVIEYLNGKCHVYENELGILTNSPPFQWHLFNLSNYINLSPVNVRKLKFSSLEIENHGQGSGLLGLPGDYTPPSRFVRASFFSHCASQQKTAQEAVCQAFHVLNTFDIFDGIVQSQDKTKNISDVTEWTIVHDRTNLKTYFRGYYSLEIQMADLAKLDFTQPGFRLIKLKKDFCINDESANAETFAPSVPKT